MINKIKNFLFKTSKIKKSKPEIYYELSLFLYDKYSDKPYLAQGLMAIYKEHKIDELFFKEGFHIKPTGRQGFIYLVKESKICAIEYEMSGVFKYDILILPEQFNNYIYPVNLKIDQEERAYIIKELKVWLKQERIKHDFDVN